MVFGPAVLSDVWPAGVGPPPRQTRQQGSPAQLMRSTHETDLQLAQVPQASMPLRSRGFVSQSEHT